MTMPGTARLIGWALPLALAASACGSDPAVPANPTWTDVEPILRAECTHCHGGTAPVTAALGELFFRFDFYDMTTEICGEAAEALPAVTLGHGYAKLIQADVTVPEGCTRGRMPPAPAGALADWQRETLIRWASAADPPRGLSAASATADQRLTFTAVIDDPDGEPVVGILKVGDLRLKMDRPGSFAADLDTSAWPAGTQPISAVLCDGWSNVAYPLGNVEIKHAR
jgi:hypothetical protein